MYISSTSSSSFSGRFPRKTAEGSSRRRRERRATDRRSVKRLGDDRRAQLCRRGRGRRAQDAAKKRAEQRSAPKWLDAQFGVHLIGQKLPDSLPTDIVQRTYGQVNAATHRRRGGIV